MNKYMELAIQEAREGIQNGHGGPFGCVIVKDNKIVGKGHNRVLKDHDATCHGEVSAIRAAGKMLNTFDLSGCDLYTTGEPCPMCLFACMWANIKNIYYGATIEDNAVIGFRDEKFNNLLKEKTLFDVNLTQIDRDECLKLFEEYNKMNKKLY